MRWPPDSAERGPIRVALVGIGTAATSAHLPILRDLERASAVSVVGLCDPDRDRCEAARQQHPAARVFEGNDEMLAAVEPDLLVIATPPSAHLGEISAAVARGVHVLCEKPLGISDADARRLGAIAAEHPHLAVATVLQYRHAEGWRWVARAAAGAVRDGEPFTIGVDVERPGTDPLSRGGWRADPEHEGGVLGDHAVHYLSLLRDLHASCAVVSASRAGPGGGETAEIRVRVAEQGLATIRVSYAAERRRNRVRLSRPKQCLEIDWRDGSMSVTHSDVAGATRTLPSLSDRAAVNALYRPMYAEVIRQLAHAGWRERATRHTCDVARLLASSLRLAAEPVAAG